MSRYNRYKLSYPHQGKKIYRTRYPEYAAEKCYKEFKELNDIEEGLFSVVNIDTAKENTYLVKKKDNKLKLKKQKRPKEREEKQKQKDIILQHKGGSKKEEPIGSKLDDIMNGINNILLSLTK